MVRIWDLHTILILGEGKMEKGIYGKTFIFIKIMDFQENKQEIRKVVMMFVYTGMSSLSCSFRTIRKPPL